MSEIIIKLDLEGAGDTLKSSIGDLEQFKQLLLDIKANKDALASAETIANVQKLTAELKKAELQVAQLQQKAIQSREKENTKLKEQSGIIGQLIQKKKDLGKELFGAKTVEDVRRINGEIAKTNIEIIKLKNTGVSSFNTFEKALASFQFKFNFLANFIGHIAGSVFSAGIGLITTALTEAIDELDIFGATAEETAERLGKLTEANINLAESLNDIQRGEIQNRIDLLKAREKLDGQTIESARKISEEERTLIQLNLDVNKKALLKKASDVRDIDKELSELDKEQHKIIKERIGDEINSEIIEREQGLTKTQRLRREALQLQRKEQLTESGKLVADDAKFKNELLINTIVLAEHIKEIHKKQSDEDKKTSEEEQKEIDKRNEILNKRFDTNFQKYLDDKKRRHDEEIKVNKAINDAIIDQRKLFDAQQKLELDEADEDKKNQLERNKRAHQDVLDAKKLAQEKLSNEVSTFEKASDAFFKQLELRSDRQKTANEQAISELDRQIDFQQELALKGEVNTLDALEKKRAEALQQKAALAEKERRQKEAQQLAELFLEFMKVYAKDGFGAATKATALTLTAKGLASAFAAEGGMMSDLMQPITGGTNDRGLFKGRSHAQGGIVTLLETQGGEGILTDKEVNNLGGAKGFYMLKDLLANPIKDDFMEHQEQSFAKAIPIIYKDDKKEYRELASKVDELISAVRNKTEWTISENLFGELVKVRKQNGVKKITTVKNTPIINGR